MRLTVFCFCLLFTTLNSFSQNCNDIFLEDKFSKDKEADFFLPGIAGYTPFIHLKFEVSGDKSYSDEQISIVLYAGTGKKDLLGMPDYMSLTEIKERGDLLLYFLFEDGKSFYISNNKRYSYPSSIELNKKANAELISYFKSKRVTDLRFVLNSVHGDYRIPLVNKDDLNSNQYFFMNLIKCLNW